MNKTLLRIIVASLATLVVLVTGSSVSAASSSIGVSPSQISSDLLIPGATYSTTLVVSRAVANDEVSAKVEVFADSFSSWITFPQGSTVKLAKGVQRANLPVTIVVPQDAKIGNYTGNIRLTITNNQAGQINIVPGVRVDISLKVTNNAVEGIKILFVRMLESAMGSPYVVLLQISNTGNVETKPDSVTIEIFDIAEKKLRELTYAFTEKVPAFLTKEVQAFIQDSDPLAVGEYWAVITVKKDGKVLATEKVAFRVAAAVLPTPTPEDQGKQETKNSLVWALFAVVGILVISALVVVFFAFFKRNEKKESLPVS